MILLAACLAIGAATATAQNVAMYSEVYNEKTGALESKEWQSTAGHYRQETADGGVHIFRRDSMQMYILNTADKTARAMPLSQMSNANALAGRIVQTGRSEERRLVEAGVDVEGYSCDYYVITVTTAKPDGTETTNVTHEWINEPLKTWIRIGYGQFLHGETSVRRNIRPGAQSASLFEIPRDYTVSRIPNLMQLMTGKPQTDAQKQQTAGPEVLLEMLGGQGGNNAGDAEKQQKLQELLKQFGGGAK